MIDFVVRATWVKFLGRKRTGGVFTERLRKTIQRDFRSISSPVNAITMCRYKPDKRIVDIVKVYIEMNNLQLELIWYCKMCWLYSRLLFKETIRCNIAHRLATEIPGRFEHKPVRTLSYLHGKTGL